MESRASKHVEALLSSPRSTTLIIGPQDVSKTFTVHTGLLRHTCSYFDAAYRSGLAESKTDVFMLEDDEPDTWEMMLVWLYNNDLYVPPEMPAYDQNPRGEGHTMEYLFRSHFSLYILAEALMCRQLQDDLITAMTKNLGRGTFFPSTQAVSSILQQLPESSPFLEFITRAAAIKLDTKAYAEYCNTKLAFPARFFQKLMKSRHDIVTSVTGSRCLSACQYHSHEKRDHCPGNMTILMQESR